MATERRASTREVSVKFHGMPNSLANWGDCTTSREQLCLPAGNVVQVPKLHVRFKPWCGSPIADTYGGKAVLDLNGEPLFAELVILRTLQQSGWDGVWVDSYRRKFRQGLPPHQCVLPQPKQALFKAIAAANSGKSSGCFDVFAWRDQEVLFVESKRKGKDLIRQSQLRWLQSALQVGISLRCFAICEWELA